MLVYIFNQLLFSYKLTSAGYAYHAIRHHGMAICQVCPKTYRLKEGFAKHIRKVHPEIIPDIDFEQKIPKEILK